MKRIIFSLVMLFIISFSSACAPSDVEIQKAIVSTQASWTSTPSSTPTKKPTFTPIPRTKTPTSTPIPTFTPLTKSIGPIYDNFQGSETTIVLTVNNIRWARTTSYTQLNNDNMIVVVNFTFVNTGPGTFKNLGVLNFQSLDANGILRNYEYTEAMEKCGFTQVDLISGGKLDACVSFQVPNEGKVEFIFAPYFYNQMEEGRYLSFILRE